MITKPAGVSLADWEAFIADVDRYRRANEDPNGEANEAAQTVADGAVRLFLNRAKAPR